MTQQKLRLALSRYLRIAGGPALGPSDASGEVLRAALREDLAVIGERTACGCRHTLAC